VTAATVVKEIWRYPVKSMAGERLERSEVGERGLWGDRGWAVRNDETGEIHNAKRFPVLMQCSARYRTPPGEDQIPEVDITLPDGEALGSDSARLSTRLSELMGRPFSAATGARNEQEVLPQGPTWRRTNRAARRVAHATTPHPTRRGRANCAWNSDANPTNQCRTSGT
jgi:hypothetical protein